MKTRRQRWQHGRRWRHSGRYLDGDMLRILAMIGLAGGMPLTYREMNRRLGMTNINTIAERIARLERLGLIAYERAVDGRRAARAVRLTCRLEMA